MGLLPVKEDCQIVGFAQILTGALDGWTDAGVFVEIGAFDGYTYSNTYELAKIGWRGLYVEPVTHLYEKCISNHQEHPNVQVMNIACGARKGTATLRTDNSGWLFTFNEHQANVLHADFTYGKATVFSLDDILKIWKATPGNIDLLSIDVEGSEPDVLVGFGVGYWKPKVVVIEAHEHHEKHKLRINAPYINQYFKNAGYHRIYTDHINNIYIKGDRA